MCGIAGIFNYTPTGVKVDRNELRDIRDQMTTRGPDDSGDWFALDDRLALGHRRLSIIDLSNMGHQPMISQDGCLVITFNGEIYNYKILKKDLEAKGYKFRSRSDTEVLLYLYKEYGIKMFEFLRGMYAFALWDKNRQGLLLVRDPFGIKPLYYADDGQTIRFASQVKALLKSCHIDKEFDLSGQAGFLLWGFVPEPFTIYKAIRSLPAGSYMWIDKNGRQNPKTFFDITETLAKAASQKIDLTPLETRKYLNGTLLESVKHHLVADVPIAVFLSAAFEKTGANDLNNSVSRYGTRISTEWAVLAQSA